MGIQQEKEQIIGSVEIIVFHNVLGDVCRSRREGQTVEDVPQDIFELTPGTVALQRGSDDPLLVFLRYTSKTVF